VAVLATASLIGLRARPRPTVAHAAAISPARAPSIPGDVRWRFLVLPIPAGLVTPDQCDMDQADWVLPGYSRAQFDGLLDSVAPLPPMRASLEAAVRCDASGCTVHPTREVIEGLRPASRGALYATLSRFAENPSLINHFSRNVAAEPWSRAEGLSPKARELLTRLSWQDGETTHFADVADVCPQLQTDAERARFIEVLKGRESVAATVFVAHGADVEPIVRYWSAAGDEAVVRPIVADAAARPEGASIELTRLLPPFARARANTFPASDAPTFDCFWTALHFLVQGEPDLGLYSAAEFSRRLSLTHDPIALSEVTLGDVLVLRPPGGPPLHAVNYVASGLVFSKNGASSRRPFILMRLSDVLALYPLATDLQAWRRRGPG
jgi:hypothetical protein